jgi:hypothetical protein
MQQMRAAGNEADVVFLANEKTIIFNNQLYERISQLAKNSLYFRFSFYMKVTQYNVTECFQVGPIYTSSMLVLRVFDFSVSSNIFELLI